MKNTIKLLGIIALLAIIGFSMVACSDDSSKSPFEGTWKNEFDDSDGHNVLTYKFTGDDFSCTYVWPGVNKSYSGTFSYTNTTITFNRTVPNVESWTQNYTITGNTLMLVRDPDGHFNGPFEKQ